MNSQRKKTKNDKSKKRDPDEEAIEFLKKDIEAEQNNRQNADLNNDELEKSVAALEKTVLELEAGNYEADDSEQKHRYDNQKQLNMQLLEQKRWLEHELEQIKLKIQNEKLNPFPDTFSLDWENLSETELKRLVVQLEKTRNEIQSDLLEMEYRLNHEAKEFHHYDYFCRYYRAEIIALNRILDSLLKNGLLPITYIITQPGILVSFGSSSIENSGVQTPAFIPQLLSPTKMNPRKISSFGSPTKKFVSPKRQNQKLNSDVNPNPGFTTQQKIRRPKVLPKIDRKTNGNADKEDKMKKSGVSFSSANLNSSSSRIIKELDTVDESPIESLDEEV